MKKLAPILGLLAALAAIPAAAQTQFPTTLPANSVWGRTGIGAGPGQAIPFSILLANLYLGLPAHSVVLAEGSGTPPVGVAPGTTGLPFVSNGASADPSYQQLTAVAMPAFTGDVTTSAGSVATTISANVVTNAKAAQAGANSVKGNFTGSTANVADNTMPSCPDSGGNHLNYVNGAGITCGSTANVGGLGAITVQRLTSGTSATYTPTGGTIRIHVRMAGGGGGGGASTINNGTAGGTTSFGGWTAIGGSAGLAAQISTTGAGPSGGSGGANGTGTLVSRVAGQNGGMAWASGANVWVGGGGNSCFGGGTNIMGIGSTTGISPAANTGSGGTGGSTASSNGGSSGGAGECAEFWMTSAQVGASQTYTVGTAGSGGAAGGNAGGNGAPGIIIVEEYPF